MSATSSSRPDVGRVVDAATAVIVAVLLVVMVQLPAKETLPYHLIFLTLTIVYGFRVWPLAPTLAIVAAVTALTGAIFVTRWSDEVIDHGELYEVPLMPTLLMAMVWHAQRRAAAERANAALAADLRQVIARERAFLSDASHAIRTPVTIARGHIDLLAPGLSGVARDDAEVVLRQLGRMEQLAGRLLALARLESGDAIRPQPTDVGALVGEIAQDWRAVDRAWQVDVVTGDLALVDPEWLHLALDALVENALKHTEPGDAVRIACRSEHGAVVLAVDDSGPGVAAVDRHRVFDRFWHRNSVGRPSGSGLGLAMVKAVAEAHRGSADVTSSPLGGARFLLRLPLAQPQAAQPDAVVV